MPHAPTTSTTLLRNLASDSQHARWSEFVARYGPMMNAFVRERFPMLDADDILQEAFLAIAKALPNYQYSPEEKGHFHNYLVGVVRNKALMALRAKNRNKKLNAAYAMHAAAEQDAAQPAGNPHAAEEDAWRKSVFEIALQQLMADPSIHERTKQIFVRTAIKQEPPEAVALSLGVSRNVVDQQKRRTLAKFKAIVSALKGAL